jgi:hypothetical protein
MTQRPGSDGARYAGSAFILGFATGTIALIAAPITLFRGDPVGSALFLVAAALAFGLLANASLRQ